MITTPSFARRTGAPTRSLLYSLVFVVLAKRGQAVRGRESRIMSRILHLNEAAHSLTHSKVGVQAKAVAAPLRPPPAPPATGDRAMHSAVRTMVPATTAECM